MGNSVFFGLLGVLGVSRVLMDSMDSMDSMDWMDPLDWMDWLNGLIDELKFEFLDWSIWILNSMNENELNELIDELRVELKNIFFFEWDEVLVRVRVRWWSRGWIEDHWLSSSFLLYSIVYMCTCFSYFLFLNSMNRILNSRFEFWIPVLGF